MISNWDATWAVNVIDLFVCFNGKSGCRRHHLWLTNWLHVCRVPQDVIDNVVPIPYTRCAKEHFSYSHVKKQTNKEQTTPKLIYSWLSRSYLNVRGANEPPGVVNEQNKVCGGTPVSVRSRSYARWAVRSSRINAQLIKNRNKGILCLVIPTLFLI